MDSPFSLVQLVGPAFSRAQARAQGFSDRRLSVAVRQGELLQIQRGAYVHKLTWDAASYEVQHALGARALMAHNRYLIATCETALALHGLPLCRVRAEPYHFLSRTTQLRRSNRTVLYPLRGVEPPASRILGVAEALALATALRPLAGIVAGDAALNARLVSRDELLAAVASTSVLRGRRRTDDYVVRHIEQMTPLAESPPETMLRVQLENAGFVVTPQLVVPVRGGREFRLDLGVSEPNHPELVVGVEYDGEAKYQGHSTLLAEKHREDAIREQGIPVVRVTSADLRDVGALAVRIRHISRQFHAKLRSA